jgi:hypothetical protein
MTGLGGGKYHEEAEPREKDSVSGYDIGYGLMGFVGPNEYAS